MRYDWKMSKLVRQLLRFGVVGGFCAALNLGLLYILVEWFRVWYLLSATGAFVVVGVIGYFLQKYITFQSRSSAHSKELLKFFSVIAIGLVLNDVVLAFFVDVLRWWYMAGSIFAAGFVAITNFLGHKYLTFAELSAAGAQRSDPEPVPGRQAAPEAES